MCIRDRNYTDNRVNYASVDRFLPSGRSRSVWNNYPIRGAFYVQDKLEFEGMVANVGLRLDYSDPQGEWYEYDPYTNAFASENSLGLDTLLKKISVEKQVDISPRIGISFPISINSKLYFNYGHFRHCLLYTSDAADERSSVDLGGRRIIKKKNNVYMIRTRRKKQIK